MGVYKLMEGKVVNGRAVWQEQGGTRELFLYRSNSSKWYLGKREHMEKGENKAFMILNTAALTPDQARPSEVCQMYDGRKFVEAAEARFVISHD
jgi:hypothetical protein